MRNKEEKNKRDERDSEKNEEVLNLRGIDGEKLAKMSVAEVVRGEGLLPFNPMHTVSDEEAEKLGAHAGAIYGASVASVGQAVTRTDLPISKRVNLGMKGIRPILSAFLTAWETNKVLTEKEDEILGLLPVEKQGVDVDATAVIATLRQQLKMSEADMVKLREEMIVLRKRSGK